jgi:hypothetical protein
MSQQSKPADPLRNTVTAIRDLRERPEERHRPSGFHFAFADRISFINAAA